MRVPSTEFTDEGRYSVASVDLVVKPPRDPPNEQHWLDLATEVFCQHLARRFDLPVIPAKLVKVEDIGPVLVSPYRGERTISDVSEDEIVNTEELARLAVFEELVMNTDDKDDHFRAYERAGDGVRVEIFDHGHTFHAWKDEISSPAEAESAVEIAQPSSERTVYPSFELRTLEEAIEEFQGLSDASVEDLRTEVTDQLRTILESEESAETFLEKLDHHSRTWATILRERRDTLASIMKQKYPGIEPDRIEERQRA